jgi:PAS domain S-box-containing protein
MVDMKDAIRVLLVEDSEDDEILLGSELDKGGFKNKIIKRVENKDDMRSSLENEDWDLIISDFVLPSFDGLSALSVLKEVGKDIPFIIVSGKIGEDTAVKIMRAGAHDYLMKGNLARLNSAIYREMREAEIRARTREAEEELKLSHEMLKKRSEELEIINTRLNGEIQERERAENELMEAKEYLGRVIDSASDLIVSFDRLFRVKIWNRSMEELTSYARKDILNRTMDKLEVFDDPKKIRGTINQVYMDKSSIHNEIVLKTKRGSKKIIDASASVIMGENSEEIGVFFAGNDITPEAEAHGRLVMGMSYLVRDKDHSSSVDLFNDLLRSGHTGLVVTRGNPEVIRSNFGSFDDLRIIMMSEDNFDNLETVDSLDTLLEAIGGFISDSERPAILIDGVHYLLIKNRFRDFMEALFRISDSVAKSQATCLIRVDPAILNDADLAILENELVLLPSQNIDGIIVRDETHDLLRYIYEQNQNNVMVSFKKVMSKFKISYVTVAKRVETLQQEGLIFTKRQGKLRAIYITEKGKALLHKRESL